MANIYTAISIDFIETPPVKEVVPIDFVEVPPSIAVVPIDFVEKVFPVPAGGYASVPLAVQGGALHYWDFNESSGAALDKVGGIDLQVIALGAGAVHGWKDPRAFSGRCFNLVPDTPVNQFLPQPPAANQRTRYYAHDVTTAPGTYYNEVLTTNNNVNWLESTEDALPVINDWTMRIRFATKHMGIGSQTDNHHPVISFPDAFTLRVTATAFPHDENISAYYTDLVPYVRDDPFATDPPFSAWNALGWGALAGFKLLDIPAGELGQDAVTPREFWDLIISYESLNAQNQRHLKAWSNGVKILDLEVGIAQKDLVLGGVGAGTIQVNYEDTLTAANGYRINRGLIDEIFIMSRPILDSEVDNLSGVNSGRISPLISAGVVENDWDLYAGFYTAADWDINYRSLVVSNYDLYTPLPSVTLAEFDIVAGLDLRDTVLAEYEIYATLVVDSEYVINYALRNRIIIDHDFPLQLSTTVLADYDLVAELDARNKAIGEYGINYLLLDDSVSVLNVDNYILKDGLQIPVLNGAVSTDEGSFVWDAEIFLTGINDYAQFRINDAFAVVLSGVSFNFIVESKSKGRPGVAQENYKIRGKSPTIKQDTPRAKPQDVTFDTDILARDAVEQLLGPIADWDYLNWWIPANRVAGKNISPVALATQIIEQGAGGVLEANSDGTFRVRYKHPVSPPDYATAVMDHNYNDLDDVFAMGVDYSPARLVDQVRIMDARAGAFEDQITFVADEADPTQGVLKVYLSPHRGNIAVVHTSNATVALNAQGEKTETLTELITFTDGAGNTERPIESIVSSEWQYTDLGGLSFEPYTSSLTSTGADEFGYSLLSLTYVARYLEYAVESSVVESVQFLVNDLAEAV